MHIFFKRQQSRQIKKHLKMTVISGDLKDIQIAIIGGSGLYSLENMTILGEKKIETPFGLPSDNIVIGELGGIKLAFLARHGRGHYLNPSDVPSMANIAALNKLGAKVILSFSAVGSLREEIKPKDFVIPSQIIDRTRYYLQLNSRLFTV